MAGLHKHGNMAVAQRGVHPRGALLYPHHCLRPGRRPPCRSTKPFHGPLPPARWKRNGSPEGGPRFTGWRASSPRARPRLAGEGTASCPRPRDPAAPTARPSPWLLGLPRAGGGSRRSSAGRGRAQPGPKAGARGAKAGGGEPARTEHLVGAHGMPGGGAAAAGSSPAFRELPREAGSPETVPGKAAAEAAGSDYELPDAGRLGRASRRPQELEST